MSIHADIVIVSPHRDDAAFSCGIVMLAALEAVSVRVVNIFTRSTYAPFNPTTEQRGLDAVTALRRKEDEATLNFLRSTTTGGAAQLEEFDLGLLDAPLRLGLLTEDVQGTTLAAAEYERQVQLLTSALRQQVEGAACVLLPLGLGGRALDGHIDHHLARDAGQRCTAPERVAFYEDLPYAARMADADREAAIEVFLSTLPDVQPMLVEHANASILKTNLAGFYASQIDAATIEEMASYTGRHSGETVYAAALARLVIAEI